MMYVCDKCMEIFHKDELVFFLDNQEVYCEEDGGSGDYNKKLCLYCYEHEEILK